jgi:NAD(P)-dependent dehydrogenase (short-subunit alcohol dehydrogenase family)
MRFENKAVIITGGGGKIAKAYAMAFAKEGAKVSLPDVVSADPVSLLRRFAIWAGLQSATTAAVERP